MIRLLAEVTVRELARRRGVVALTLLLPLSFYLVRIGTHWTALRLLAIGLGWAVATLALFTAVSARGLDRRLALAGAAPTALVAGRQLALLAVGGVVAAAYFVLVAATIAADLQRLAPVALLLALTVAVAAPLGALVAALVPRDLEGALLLLSVMAVQVLVDPSAAWTRALPMWSTREIATYAVEPVGADHLVRGLAHGAITVVTLTLVAWAVTVWRLRPAPVADLDGPAPAVGGLRAEDSTTGLHPGDGSGGAPSSGPA